MVDVKVCRVCLDSESTLFDFRGKLLDTYFEPIIGIVPSLTALPAFACFQCAALIKKYYNFRQKCLLGQATLYDILNSNGKISQSNIKEINYHKLKFPLKLSIHTIPEEAIINIIHQNAGARKQVEDDAFLVKEEEIKNIETEDLIKDIKVEEDLPDFPNAGISSDDDYEPLSVVKSNKEKTKPKKVRKKIMRRKTKVNKVEIEIDVAKDLCLDAEQLSQLEATDDMSALPPEIKEVVQRKGRGRPRKSMDHEANDLPRKRKTNNTGGVEADDINLEQFVNIIKLSVEEQLEEITKRKESSNFLNAAYQCEQCYKGFIDTAAWKNHVRKHDPSAGDVVCSICKFRFKDKRKLQKHAVNHEKKYSCKSCAYVSKTPTQAKQHQRWHKGVTYRCQYCDEESTKWTSYLSHVRIKHPSEFICGVCGYSFVSKLGLAMHRTMMHKDAADKQEDKKEGADEKAPYCDTCDVQFLSTEAWKRHMVTSVKHTQHKDFGTKCRACGETFENEEEQRMHHRREHPKVRPKNYGKKPTDRAWPAKCEHCEEMVSNARDYWSHFRRVHPDKKYPIIKAYICEICGKSFRGNAFLLYHKRTHFAERAYQCRQCPKAFFNRTNLQMHERTHSDHRPYPCTVCFKAFKCKGALDRHFRSHTGEKPYECEFCGKSFNQSNSRKLHVRTVHLKEPAPYISRSRLERRKASQAVKEAQHNFVY